MEINGCIYLIQGYFFEQKYIKLYYTIKYDYNFK